jgi:nucleoside-triphosphatase THEP1
MTLIDREAQPLSAGAALAVLVHAEGDAADAVMAGAAETLAAAGWRVAGAVQANLERPDRRRCDMRLRDLASGEETLISQDLGDEAEGCRLDLDAFARASLLVERALEAGADVLIVNRFGKQEAQGRGFVGAIAQALGRGAPVVVAVSPQNLDACEAFAGEPLQRLAPDATAIADWCARAIAAAGAAR